MPPTRQWALNTTRQRLGSNPPLGSPPAPLVAGRVVVVPEWVGCPRFGHTSISGCWRLVAFLALVGDPEGNPVVEQTAPASGSP
jgi:hypothetical protein